MQGTDKNNVFIVMDESGRYIGNGFLHPKVTHILTPDHPLNIFIEINLEPYYLNHKIGQELLKILKRRAEAIFKASAYKKGLLYYGADQLNEKISFFIEHGFTESYNTQKMKKKIKQRTYKKNQYELVEIKEDYKDLIELHNQQLLKPIDDEIIHHLSHENHFKVYGVYEEKKLIASTILYSKDHLGIIDHIAVSSNQNDMVLMKYLTVSAEQYFLTCFIQEVSIEVWSAISKEIKMFESLGYKNDSYTEFYVACYLK